MDEKDFKIAFFTMLLVGTIFSGNLLVGLVLAVVVPSVLFWIEESNFLKALTALGFFGYLAYVILR